MPFFLRVRLEYEFIQMRSRASTDRKALLTPRAGPLADFVVALPSSVVCSTVVPLPARQGMLNPDALNLTVTKFLSGAAQQAGARPFPVDR